MASSHFPIPQGTLDMLILQILSLEPAHGYGIAQRLEQVTREAVRINQGSLYPALHRLEQKGWLKSEWRNHQPQERYLLRQVPRDGRRRVPDDPNDPAQRGSDVAHYGRAYA